MRIDSLIIDFLEYLEIERACSSLTIREYKHYLMRFNVWVNKNYPNAKPDSINLDLIRRYRIFLAHMRNRNGVQLSRVTQSYHVIVLRAFLRYLLVQRDINTLSPDKIELPKQKSRSINFLNMDQVDRLLGSPDISSEAGLRDKAILEMLFSTGLRVSELVKLNRDQVNLEKKEFGIRGKGNRLRVVFLSNNAAHWIDRYLQYRKDRFKPLFIRYGGSMDMTKDGERMRLTARSVQKIAAKYAKKCGLPMKVSPHTLRHSFATDLMISGADIRSVQEMLGHESIRTTQVYTHVTNRHLKEVHESYHSRK